MTKPLVTVLIDTYNHERFIEQAIASVLEQGFPRAETEILVVDDGSSDRTPEIVRKFEPQVRLLRKSNGGQASAFNAGIPEAQGEIISFLDGDDWWAPAKLTRVVEVLRNNPDVGIVGHGITEVFPDGLQKTHVLREGCHFQANTIEGARLFRVRGGFLGTSRMTARSQILRRLLPVPEALTIQADEYLFTLAAAVSEVRILPEPLVYYRLHDSNAYHMTKSDPKRLRRKQKVLAELPRCLEEQLRVRGVDNRAVRAIVEIAQANADQLRLMIYGGWPWETVKTEWKISQVVHADATFSYQIFKLLTLLVASVTPPKTFYHARRRLAQNGLYRRARERWLPIPEMSHIQRDWRAGS